jgi:hypothetical protein
VGDLPLRNDDRLWRDLGAAGAMSPIVIGSDGRASNNWRPLVARILGFLAAVTLLLAHAQAQTSPAQMGITPTTVPEVLQVLDKTKTWVTIGTVDSGTHTFSGGGNRNITNVLRGNSSAVWTASFHAGVTDLNGKFLGGTEGRQFATKNEGQPIAQLFLATGYWMDQPGAEGPQNAQVLVLNGPEREGNAWQEEVNFGATGLPNYVTADGSTSYCPTDNHVCSLVTSALADLNWQWDNNQNPVTVQTMVASTWWQGTSSITCPGQTPVYVFTKNNTPSDLHWYQTLLGCDTATSGAPQVRAFGVHTDQVLLPTVPTQWAFAGEAPTGIFTGQLSHSRTATLNPIIWNTGLSNVEWKASSYVGPACTAQTRVMGFAEIKGSDNILRIYMSACFNVYVRIDGNQATCLPDQVLVGGVCQQRWKLYWTNPNPADGTGTNGSSQSGMRALTAVPAEGVMLIGAEGGAPQFYYAIKPYPACATPTDLTCATAEYGVFAGTQAGTGLPNGPAGQGPIGNTVAVYNNFVPLYDENGVVHYIAPQSTYVTSPITSMPPSYTFMYLGGTGSGKKIAEGIYTFRNSAGRYNFAFVPQLFSTPMNGVRDMIASPFADDCGYYGVNVLNCAVYATGNDADGSSLYYWCKANPCPTPIPYVPMHNLAWAARLGYPGP